MSHHFVINAGDPIPRDHFPQDAIFFFDFDGVLADQDEEKLFRLPEGEGERPRLVGLAKSYGIDPRLYPDTGYLRHLVYQSVMSYQAPAFHREMLAFMLRLEAEGSPTFVITARSGRAAVERVFSFLDHHLLDPQEVFCLGRSSKADLLTRLRKDWPDRPFVFFEDSKRHIDECVALPDPKLYVMEVQWPACTQQAETMLAKMYEHCDV